MNRPQASAREIAAEVKKLYGAPVDDLLLVGKNLIENLPEKRPRISQNIFFATVERLFILVQHTINSFSDDLEAGYYTTASLARGLMETATTLAILSRDKNGEMYSAYLRQQELHARKRHDGLLHSQKAKDRRLADYAKTETGIASRVLDTLKQVRANAHLPLASEKFPDMATRCKVLGENWEFLYNVVYRDLCEAVHGTFLKTLLSPGIALTSPNQGDALLFEHCRTVGYGFEFWAYAVLECCQKQADKTAVKEFCDKVSKFLDADARLINGFPTSSRSHKIVL